MENESIKNRDQRLPPENGSIWPDENEQRAPAAAEESVEAQTGRGTVLVVDDDPDVRDILRKSLKIGGYRVMLAQDGLAALELLRKELPDLIILDDMMPRMTGRELLTRLHELGFVDRTMVVMLTALPEKAVDRKKYLSLGASAVLFKPFGQREMRMIVDNLFTIREVQRRNVELRTRVERTEHRFRDFVESADDLIFTLDLQQKLVFLNQRFDSLTHFEREEWIGRSFLDLVIPTDRSVAQNGIERALRGQASRFEVRVSRHDGRILYLSVNLNPIREESDLVGLVGIARDVTEKRRLEDRVRELSEFNESILHSLGSGLVTVNGERRITFFNDVAEQVLGYEAFEVLGRPFDELFPEVAKSILPDDLLQKGGSLASQEISFQRRDGRKIHLGYSVTCRGPRRDQRVAAVITFRDITEMKEMQAQVLRMDRLASLGVLASGIAHEIRNPLAGIKMMAQTLEEEISEEDPHREYLTRIIRQVNRLDELIKVFFSYAKPRQPVRRLYRLPEIVNEVTALLRKKLENRGIAFREQYTESLPPVHVDFHQMQQVFMNLFLNAIDAMPEGGQLTVRAEAVTTTLHAVDRRGRRHLQPVTGRFVRVEVEDTGHGIPDDVLGSIFDPFFTTKPQGMGLGLSIVYRIVEEHGGEITVTSEMGKGTRFTLLLPTKEQNG